MEQYERLTNFLEGDQWKKFNRTTFDELPLYADPLSLLFDSDARSQCQEWLSLGGDDPSDYEVIAGCCFVEGAFESEAMFITNVSDEKCPVYFCGTRGLSALTPIAPTFDGFLELLAKRYDSFEDKRQEVQDIVTRLYNETNTTNLSVNEVLEKNLDYDSIDDFTEQLSEQFELEDPFFELEYDEIPFSEIVEIFINLE